MALVHLAPCDDGPAAFRGAAALPGRPPAHLQRAGRWQLSASHLPGTRLQVQPLARTACEPGRARWSPWRGTGENNARFASQPPP